MFPFLEPEESWRLRRASLSKIYHKFAALSINYFLFCQFIPKLKIYIILEQKTIKSEKISKTNHFFISIFPKFKLEIYSNMVIMKLLLIILLLLLLVCSVDAYQMTLGWCRYYCMFSEYKWGKLIHNGRNCHCYWGNTTIAT